MVVKVLISDLRPRCSLEDS